MKIVLTQGSTSVELPVLPPSYTITSKQNNSIETVNAIGEVNLLGKKGLRDISFSSFFPKHGGSYSGTLRYSPKGYVDQIEKMKRKGPVKLHFLDLMSIPVTIEEFQWEESDDDQTGDIHYTLTLKEYQYVKVKTSASTGIQVEAESRQTATKPSPTTYTVKSGDCLSAIAKKLGLSGWDSLYSSNKKLIGTNPNRIYPGQKLVIPS
jgi:LysM repeat protein